MAVYKIEIFIFANCFLKIFASHHWIVTENGKIQARVENSGFPLIKNDDLLVFLEQEQRLTAIDHLYKQLLSLKKSIDVQWSKIEEEGDLEKKLYATDEDCLLGGVPLSQHNLNTEFIDYGQGSRPKMKDAFQSVDPDCTAYFDLDFSMRTFPHLDTLNKKDFNLIVKPVPSKTAFDFNIDAMLKLNSSDWTAYNIASLYWRTLGNGSNAVECAKRALFFAPMSERYIVLLNLGTLLQELHSLGEAAIVLHSAVDHDPEQHISHLALGNVYAALGDYRRALACYDNVLSLNPENVQALQLKHALLCRKKLESGLLEIHSSLQHILQDLQKHNAMHEEWLHLQNQINWERDSKIKEFFSLTQPLYLNLRMLLQNVEQQAKTLNEEVSKIVPRNKHIKLEGEEKNRVKSVCSFKQCPTYIKNVEQEIDNSIHNSKEVDDGNEESELETFYNSEHLLKDKMVSLINLIKSKYEQRVKKIDLKRNINEQFNFMGSEAELNRGTHFSVDESLLLNNIDACVKDSTDVKKLN